jgi:hypothetical protein
MEITIKIINNIKTYQSTTEGTWVEILKVELTAEQKALMVSTNKEDKEARLTLVQSIKAKREAVVPEGKAAELISFYDSVRPELKEEDIYELISIDAFEKEDGVFTGILNCRVNGEHTQIRVYE